MVISHKSKASNRYEQNIQLTNLFNADYDNNSLPHFIIPTMTPSWVNPRGVQDL